MTISQRTKAGKTQLTHETLRQVQLAKQTESKVIVEEAAGMQAGPLGQTSLQFTVPEGLLLDDSGDSITDAQLAPSDIATVLIAITAATIDLRAGHQNFTLNNMIACLVATDILQASFRSSRPCRSDFLRRFSFTAVNVICFQSSLALMPGKHTQVSEQGFIQGGSQKCTYLTQEKDI